MNKNTLESSSPSTQSTAQQKPCDGCKAHHIRCDKNTSGCKNCSKRGINCTYLIKRKKRGPKPKHYSRNCESENNINIGQANNDQTPNILITQEDNNIKSIGEEYYNNQYSSELCIDFIGSPNLSSSLVFDDNTMYQTSPTILPLYQNVHNPMLDTGYYDLPLPLDLSSAVTTNSLTMPMPMPMPTDTIIATSMEFEQSPAYSSLNQFNFQNSTIYDQNGYPMYFI